MDKERIEGLVSGLKSGKAIRDALSSKGIRFDDVSGDYGFPNFHIPVPDGYIGVALLPKEDVRVRRFYRVEMKWSGIPVFEPSGRPSF